jgi:hypothetical protein|nr:MAG TPA: hypothetical protein [Caudoviricetes sp.]
MLGCKDEFYRVKFSNILSKVFRKKQFFSPRTCSFISWWWLLCNSFTIKDGNITAIDYDRFYDCLKFILNDSHKAWKAHKAQQEAESQRKAAEERKREEGFGMKQETMLMVDTSVRTILLLKNLYKNLLLNIEF